MELSGKESFERRKENLMFVRHWKRSGFSACFSWFPAASTATLQQPLHLQNDRQIQTRRTPLTRVERHRAERKSGPISTVAKLWRKPRRSPISVHGHPAAMRTSRFANTSSIV